ncbi:MAG: Uma2 family endonuclease [Anaerolineae bacterium]|nr:Uma2 family endonuclease [Anaerolineae bacterium]
MVAVPSRAMTADEFEDYDEFPENADKLLEFVSGEVYEVPSNAYASMISARIAGYIFIYLLANNIAYLTTEAGGYVVFGERYAPDVAVVRKEKQLEPAKVGYNPIPPDLAVEVDFPSTQESCYSLNLKLGNYLAAGTVVWIVNVDAQEIEVYAPGQPTRVLTINDPLDGGDILPGFRLPVKDVFTP